MPTDVNGIVSFEKTTFLEPSAQEAAYRTAKQIWETLGNKDKSDECFYKEMEAKRKQKKPSFSFKNAVQSSILMWRDKSERGTQLLNHKSIKRYLKSYTDYYLEWPIQHITGYWVYPSKVLRAFAIFVFFFGLLFWLIGQSVTAAALGNSMWQSFLTLFNPIGKIENAQPRFFGAVTVIAGFIGLLTWPVFIATLAKK